MKAWNIRNGSGWNHHKTVDALRALDKAERPSVPKGYAVLVAPISDKPLGLRCALVKECGRKFAAFINIHVATGNYTECPAAVRAAVYSTADEASAVLSNNGYLPTDGRPPGWPAVGLAWYRHADGTWASVEMLDDGPDSDNADGWVRDRFNMDGEIVYSVKCTQQSDDDSQYFIKSIASKLAAIY